MLPRVPSCSSSSALPTPAYKSTVAARVSNPSQLGFPLPQSAAGDVKGKYEAGRSPSVGVRRLRRAGAGPSRRAHLLPLLPLHPAVVFIHVGEHAPPLFTHACTTARGHKGENELPRSSVVPQPSSRGGTPPFATVPPRSPLVMPAFVLGWVYFSCRSRYRPHRARVVLYPASRFFGPPCRATPFQSAAVAETPACTRPRACEIPGAIAQPCTPRMHVHASWKAKVEPLALLPCVGHLTDPLEAPSWPSPRGMPSERASREKR
jgi:hypothetical protein